MSRGRHREFDEQVALERAMEVFWRNGYSGTSLSQLTDAMSVNRPSLYGAFGNKEQLFVRALNAYISRYGAPHMDRLRASGAPLRIRVKNYLDSIAQMLSDPQLPGGCLVASSTCEAGGDYLPVEARQAVEQINAGTRGALIDFFQAEVADGNLRTAASPEALADYLLALQYGLAVMARSGAGRDALGRVIEAAASQL